MRIHQSTQSISIQVPEALTKSKITEKDKAKIIAKGATKKKAKMLEDIHGTCNGDSIMFVDDTIKTIIEYSELPHTILDAQLSKDDKDDQMFDNHLQTMRFIKNHLQAMWFIKDDYQYYFYLWCEVLYFDDKYNNDYDKGDIQREYVSNGRETFKYK